MGPLEKFNTALTRDQRDFMGKRYGKPWSPEERETLRAHFNHGLTLPQLMTVMQRPAAGILAKLGDMHLLVQKDGRWGVYYRRAPRPIPTLFLEQTEMAKNIETVVMIRGEDAAQKTDEQIFSFIAKLEAEIKSLEAINCKPKKLTARIKELQDDITKLVEYVDGR